jgi:outer membrane biosynthesis protein TonB
VTTAWLTAAPALLLAALQSSAGFEAPRVRSASLASLPYEARAAGLVVLDVSVDTLGTVSGIRTVKELEPFGEVLRQSVSSWPFEPARDSSRVVSDASAFDDASLEAARRWAFRPARHGGRAAPSRAYILFVYRQPM